MKTLALLIGTLALAFALSNPAQAGTALLTWTYTDTVPKQSNFILERAEGACDPLTNVFGVAATPAADERTYTDADGGGLGVPLVDGNIYCWRMAAQRGTEVSGYSNTVQKTIGALPAPGNLQVDVTVTLDGVPAGSATFAITLR